MKSIDALVAALTAGASVAEAAKQARISERTAYRRLAEPQTQQQIRALRAAALDRAVGQLSESLTAAVATLVRNLDAEQSSVQVRAAVALLEQSRKLRASEELERRLAAAEADVADEESLCVAA